MTKKIDDAMRFAVQAHEGQVRRIVETPYVLHPMEVAVIMSRLGAGEDALCAALLHDTVEDAGVTAPEIEASFGPRVRELVETMTEKKRPELPAEETWLLRKTEALDRLNKSADPDHRKLWLSDKLSNMRALYQNYLRMGDKVFSYFHRTEKAAHAWFYRKSAELLPEYRDTAAGRELQWLLLEVFGPGSAEDALLEFQNQTGLKA